MTRGVGGRSESRAREVRIEVKAKANDTRPGFLMWVSIVLMMKCGMQPAAPSSVTVDASSPS